MKGIFGAILIYLTYICAGLLMNTWPFKYGFEGLEVFTIFNIILIVLLYFSTRIINKYKGINGATWFLIWYLLSTIYGIWQMNKMYKLWISGNWNKFFGWEFALWEGAVPIYIGVSQLILIFCHFFYRIFKDEWKNRSDISS